MTDLRGAQREALGAFIREQRKRADLSLRQLAELTRLSHAYLSQIERGLHQPSVRVLRAISEALNLSAWALLAEAGLFDAIAGSGQDRRPARPNPAAPATEQAIRRDERLSADQKAALIAVYRSMLGVLFNVRVGAIHLTGLGQVRDSPETAGRSGPYLAPG